MGMSNSSLDHTRVDHSLREANAAYRDCPSLVRIQLIPLPHGFMLFVGFVIFRRNFLPFFIEFNIAFLTTQCRPKRLDLALLLIPD